MEVETNNGATSTSIPIVLDKWMGDFSRLYNPTLNSPLASQNTDNVEPKNIDIQEAQILNCDITLPEVKIALSAAKCGKAPGLDNIPVDVLKNDTTAYFLTELFDICFKNSITPKAWQQSVIHPIPKDNTKDKRNPSNYRGLALASSIYKLYCGILNNRLSRWAELSGKLADEQNGFRKQRSCYDHLSSLSLITETRRKRNQPTYTAFIDFSKAFDRIDRN